MGQEFGSGLAEELWLGVCHKFTVMMLAGVAVILMVDWIRRIHFQDGSCTWLLVADLRTWERGPLQRAAWTSSQHGKWLLPEQTIQDSKMQTTMYFLKNNVICIFWLCWVFFVEKEMATRSSILAWRIPETEEPGGLLSMGSHRVVHDWSDLAAAAAVFVVAQALL